MKGEGIVALVVSLAFICQPVLAGGTAAAPFLELGAGARYLAMGEAAAAVADDANALYWNPARLAEVQERSFSGMYGTYVESINYQFLCYAQPADAWGSLGGSIQTFSAGDIKNTDDTGQEIGTYNPKDMAFALGWGRRFFKKGSAGLAGKFVHSKIINSASTWAMDAGVGWNFSRAQTALTMRNIGGRLRYDRESSELPVSTHVGASTRLKPDWLLSVEASFPKEAATFYAAGTEIRLNTGALSAIFFRAGYNTRTHHVPGFEGASFGFGWLWKALRLDYAWIPLGEIDQTHRISVTLAPQQRKK